MNAKDSPWVREFCVDSRFFFHRDKPLVCSTTCDWCHNSPEISFMFCFYPLTCVRLDLRRQFPISTRQTHHFTVNHFACSSHLLALASREKAQQQPPPLNKANTREIEKEQKSIDMCLVSVPQEPPSTDKLAVLLKLIYNKCSQSAVTQLRFTLFSFHFAFRFLFFFSHLSIRSTEHLVCQVQFLSRTFFKPLVRARWWLCALARCDDATW